MGWKPSLSLFRGYVPQCGQQERAGGEKLASGTSSALYLHSSPFIFKETGRVSRGEGRKSQTSVSVFGEEEMVERGQRECPEVQRNLSLATVVKRAKLLRTENCKLADVYWLLFFLILPDSFLALKVQTLHQRA